jgi:hypothetical protein
MSVLGRGWLVDGARLWVFCRVRSLSCCVVVGFEFILGTWEMGRQK